MDIDQAFVSTFRVVILTGFLSGVMAAPAWRRIVAMAIGIATPTSIFVLNIMSDSEWAGAIAALAWPAYVVLFVAGFGLGGLVRWLWRRTTGSTSKAG